MHEMTKLQKWLGIASVVFVIIYLGAAILTIRSRIDNRRQPTTIEATSNIEKERHLLLPELLLPMGILLALSVSYLIVKRRNARAYERLDEAVDEIEEDPPMSRSVD